MRLRLLRRRLTVTAPRMAIRSALPWPLRWALLALALGFSAALALWAFEKGREIAGMGSGTREALVRLQTEHQQLLQERNELKAVTNTVDSLLVAERSMQAELSGKLRQLEDENRELRAELQFYEDLIPMSESGVVAVRGLRLERPQPELLRWRVLLMQPERRPSTFDGEMELLLNGSLAGKPWQHSTARQPIRVERQARLQGEVAVPAPVVLQSVTARLWQSGEVKGTHTQRLQRP